MVSEGAPLDETGQTLIPDGGLSGIEQEAVIADKLKDEAKALTKPTVVSFRNKCKCGNMSLPPHLSSWHSLDKAYQKDMKFQSAAFPEQHDMDEDKARLLVQRLYGDYAFEEIPELPRTEKRRMAAELLLAGLSMRQAANIIKVNVSNVSRWFSNDTPEMQRLMKEAWTKDAMLEVPRTWKRLKALRYEENAETSRKAILDCFRAAGLSLDMGNPSTFISVRGKNVQINQMSNGELDRKIMELANSIGPQAMKLVESELSEVNRSNVPGTGGVEGERAGDAGTVSGPAGGTAQA